MRKLLLGTTALAAAATLTANAAFADVSISGAYEWNYTSRTSDVTSTDGTDFGTDSEIKFTFTNKTDSGLTITAVSELEADGDGTATMDEHSISISGGFGTVKLGSDDSVGDNFGIEAEDLIAEEDAIAINSATIGTDSDITASSGDSNKISYYLPAMGGFTMGVSHTDSGAVGASDSTEYGAQYVTEMGGSAITLGAAAGTTDAATKDIKSTNKGVKIVNGNISVAVAEGTYVANDEDLTSRSMAISYNMGDGMTIGAYTMSGDDGDDANEEMKKSGAELQYTIASGLTAVITLEDYEYTAGTSETTVSDKGQNTKLTIKASF